MAVRKIELETVESNLRNVSSSAENIRKLQEEMEAALREYDKERTRYKTGEIARDVFENLTKAHEERTDTMNRKIASLIETSRESLTRVTSLVEDHMPMRERRARRVVRKEARRHHHKAAARKEARRRK